MKTKKMLFKLGLFAMVVWCFCMSSTLAMTSFKLNIEKINALNKEYISNNIIPIHFADNWNDFGWFFYFSNGVWIDEDDEWDAIFHKVTVEGSGYECNRQVKWFYYNAERWERLRPLDQGTRATGLQDKITTTWWLFTVCSIAWYAEALSGCVSDNNGYEACKQKVNSGYSTPVWWYYGQVTHTYSWQTMRLIVWVDYDTGSSRFITITGWFSPSLVRINNQFPAWFIYDYNWWVGFVWCRVGNGTEDTWAVKKMLHNYYLLKNTYHLDNPLTELFYISGENLAYVESNGNYSGYTGVKVDCSNAVRDSLLWIVIEWVVWMWRSWTLSNSEYIWNPMNQKMQFFSSNDINSNTVINYARKKAELLCRWKWDTTQWDVVCITNKTCQNDSYDATSPNNNKTIIAKNCDVKIKPFETRSDWKYYDIFIDSWNLIIEENTGSDMQFVFNRNWFKWTGTKDQFIAEVTEHQWGVGNNVAIGSFIRWNFIVNWVIKPESGSGLYNKYFIHWKVTTRDTFNTLLETFKWRCRDWIDTNDVVCPKSNWDWKNPYEVASLVIIDQNYKSPLFKN